MLRLGIDLDGCVCDFTRGFSELIKKETGIQLPRISDTYPNTWNYHLAAGVTAEQNNHLWETIKNSFFWGKLHALPGALEVLGTLRAQRYFSWHIYFITSRPGADAKYFTEQWLSLHGMAFPTVLIASEKGPLAKGLELDVFVDDKPENCLDVLAARPECRVYLVDAPYNRIAIPHQITRVVSVGEVIALEQYPAESKRSA